MMNRKSIFFSILTIFLISLPYAGPLAQDSGKKWLREVEPIISKSEKSVFESLRIEEDRMRFIDSFWRVRDPDPQTPQNEYKIDYYKRLNYVESNLGGTRSDRGRIYMILGEPVDKSNYVGASQVVECELWTYYSEGRPGLPPVMNLLFYRRENIGRYKLFYPGMDTASDILAPGHRYGRESSLQAYREIRKTFSELADATLSVIPGEGTPGMPATASSSSHVFAQVFSLPEKEASENYLRGFQSVEGVVDVTYSFKDMPGRAAISVSENRGFRFLNYSVLPDVIRTSQITEDLYSAKLNLNLRIEDMEGNTIYQQEKNLDFRLDGKQKKAIDEKKAMFSGFAPIISGIFNVNIVLANKTTEEFFVYEERLELDHETVPVLLGYKAEESLSDSFVPFSTDKHKMSFDPRYVYNKTDSIEGIVFADSKPQIYLINVDDESDTFEILDIEEQGRYFVFKQPLADKKSSNYYFSVMISGEEVYRKIIAVLPFLAKKPVTFEWFDPLTSGPAYNFEIATQHLHVGNTEAALEYFNEIPENLWNSFTIPTIAKAYYQKKDYKKVVELLEREDVTKNYSALLLLGNSCLELKQLGKAAEYFEQLRNYGDTVRINHILGAVFLSLGDREKAKAYYDRAKELEGKSEVKKEEKRQ